MARMELGSKPDEALLYHDEQSWHCSPGVSSDVILRIGDTSFHLHKFPLLSKSGKLKKLIEEAHVQDGNKCLLQLDDLPGGSKAFLLVTKYCYGVRIELNASNVVGLRCASEYLQMTEWYKEGNLISQTECFLQDVFSTWPDTLKALKTCEEFLPYAEELHIVSRCIDSLAQKACADPGLFSWQVSSGLWNGISTTARTCSTGQDWWFEDASSLKLPLFRQLIQAAEAKGIKAERIVVCLIFYARKHLHLLGILESSQNENSSSRLMVSTLVDADQKNILEEIVELLPDQTRVTPTGFLLKLLRAAMMLNASDDCRQKLEKTVGLQLDQAAVEDLLIPNTGYSVTTLYDIACVQRILEHFMLADKYAPDSEEDHLICESHSLTSMTVVARLVDGYLAEVASDENLKLLDFESLAGIIPDYARPVVDGIYRAVDIYLKSHPCLADSDREKLCKLINYQKLSLEASTHAAQNERLPLRVILQVLFFEQLRIRTSLAGFIFVSDILGISHDPGARESDQVSSIGQMMERVAELEVRCLSLKREMEKLMKSKGVCNDLCRKLGFILKLMACDTKINSM